MLASRDFSSLPSRARADWQHDCSCHPTADVFRDCNGDDPALRQRRRGLALCHSVIVRAAGFIARDEQGNDLFIHHLSIAASGSKSLAEGPKVSYDAEQGPEGPAATNV